MTEAPLFFAETPTVADNVSSTGARRADALSDILEAVRLRGCAIVPCATQGPFGIVFPSGTRSLIIVESGAVVVRIEGVSDAISLGRGDLLLLPHGHAHVVADEEGRSPTPIGEVVASGVARGDSAAPADVEWLWGSFQFDDMLADRLLSALPRFIVLHGLKDRSLEWLDLGCRFMVEEVRMPRPGSGVMISRLLDLLFIPILRAWANGENAASGWLVGAMDPKVGKALAAMHAAPERQWRVSDLARHVGLSRSAFADRFLKLVGVSPAAYLTGLRLDKGAELLRDSPLPVSEIAFKVGYQAEAAFSRAFRTRFGLAPLKWRRAPRSRKLEGDGGGADTPSASSSSDS